MDYEEDVPECPPRTPEELPIGNPHETELDPGEYTPGSSWLQPPNPFGMTKFKGLLKGILQS